MKLSTIFAGLAVMFLAAQASAATYHLEALSNGAAVWEMDSIICDTAGYDIINGASDSTNLVVNWKPEPGWQYYLVTTPATDGGTGDPEFIVQIKTEDYKGNLIQYTTLVDTINASAGVYTDLGIGQTRMGYQYDIVLRAGAGNGAADHKVNRCYIFRRRPLIASQVGGR